MKTKFKFSIRATCHLFAGVVCVGAALLAASAQAQNLFVANCGSANNIIQITPGGVQSTFAFGLGSPEGLAFNSAGDLFAADSQSGNIYKFTPGGTRTTFASGFNVPYGLAFDSAGNLFVSDGGGNDIIMFTPGGVRSAFASGLNDLLDWPLTAWVICLRRICTAVTSMNSHLVESEAPLPPDWLVLGD